MRKKNKIENLKIKNFMSKKPFSVEENTLASDVLLHMNKKKITNVCIFKKKNKDKTIGVLHIHDLINNLR
jgi:arabinose-5-phosphate isomerase